jgi:hypothetical protein
MARKRGRTVAASFAVAVGVAVTGAGGGTAAADAPRVLGTCLSSVQGAPGQQVALAPSAVLQPISDVLAPVDPLGVIVPAFRQAWLALPPIAIGAIPTTAGVIPGDAIAGAVVDQLRTVLVVGPVIDVLAPRVWLAVAQGCAVAVQPVGVLLAPAGGQPAPPPPSAPPGGSGGEQPGGGSSGGASGRPAPAPVGTAGAAGQRTGSGPPGVVPPEPAPERATGWAGAPGGSGPSVLPEGVMVYNSGPPPQPWAIPDGLIRPGDGLSVNPTDMTGRAEPLAAAQRTQPAVNEVIVLATLMLAFVAAQLVRAWARRPVRVGRHAAVLGLPPPLRRLLRLSPTPDTAG